jgi:hypothetical protein
MKKNLKTFITHLKAQPLFVEIFDNAESVFINFNRDVDPDIQICYAFYEYEDYSGDAFVIYYRKSTRKYYEAHGSHCSCYGLEDQWTGDEELSFEGLEHRVKEGHHYGGMNKFAQAFEEYLKEG